MTVRIPAGIADGQRLRIYGEGEHGTQGGPTGDLYVIVHVAAHAFFHREGDDLFAEVPVPFHVMALGGTFKLNGPGGPLDVHVPANSSNGAMVTFRSKGMPSVAGHGRGSLHVRLVVDVPKKLTKDQKKLIEQLGQSLPQSAIEPTPVDTEAERPFFDKVKDLFG